jgi:dTDP-4-dehydrorhamnose reductase
MIPHAFLGMILRAGGTKDLAKATWQVLEPSVSQTDLYHMTRLEDGSFAALDYLMKRFTAKVLLTAIEQTAPSSGKIRCRELVRLEDGLLSHTDAHGAWK